MVMLVCLYRLYDVHGTCDVLVTKNMLENLNFVYVWMLFMGFVCDMFIVRSLYRYSLYSLYSQMFIIVYLCLWSGSCVYCMIHAPSTCDSKQPLYHVHSPEKRVNNTGLLTTIEDP